MFDAQCDLAALVYEPHDDPDGLLRAFAANLNAGGFRAVGMVQAGRCADSSLSALLVHSGETVALAQDCDPAATGCRLDIERLRSAGERIAGAIEDGADLVIINRFGKRERDGKGLGHLIKRAFEADIPVVIAVSSHRFTDWTRFCSGMSVKLACRRDALEAWWSRVSLRAPSLVAPDHSCFCAVFK